MARGIQPHFENCIVISLRQIVTREADIGAALEVDRRIVDGFSLHRDCVALAIVMRCHGEHLQTIPIILTRSAEPDLISAIMGGRRNLVSSVISYALVHLVESICMDYALVPDGC